MTKSYLGVDLGATSIKIVELKEEAGRPRLLTYGYTEQMAGYPEKEFTDTPERSVDLIKQVCVKAKTVSKQAVAALPSASVFSSVINIPAAPGKDLAAAVQWEAKKIIPLPLEEMILDWKVLTQEGENGVTPGAPAAEPTAPTAVKTTQVLLTAAAKTMVKKYLDIFKGAGLSLVSLETETFALVRSLIGIDKSTVVLVDMGAASTTISIIDNGVPYLNRSLNIGGLTITKEIAASLGIDINQAEQMKYDVGMTGAGVGQGGVPKIVERGLSMLLNEIKYCSNIYQSQEGIKGRRIEKVVLTGGGSLLPNFADYLSTALNTRVFIGSPWARVIYPEELRPILDQIGPKFSVAIGLAMRELE
jgi:type IV pilus assembly protein PilM